MGNLNHSIEVIVLAAGNSSRLGQAKQLVLLNNEPLLARQCSMALSITKNVTCVLGSNATEFSRSISHLPVKIVVNESWEQGLASSIAAGVNAINQNRQSVMLLLVDQWQLQQQELEDFYQFSKQHPNEIVSAIKTEVSCEDNKKVIGPPVTFPQCYFAELKELVSGNGAKPVIEKHKQQLITYPLPSAFVDLDTPAQLEYFNKMQKNKSAE